MRASPAGSARIPNEAAAPTDVHPHADRATLARVAPGNWLRSTMQQDLRAIERVIVRQLERGAPVSAIAMSLRKKPGTVRRIAAIVDLVEELELERDHSRSTDANGLRPIERCILRLRAEGQSVGEVASRLRRSGGYVQRVEAYTRLKQAGASSPAAEHP